MENGKEIFLGFRAVKEVLKQLWKEKKKKVVWGIFLFSVILAFAVDPSVCSRKSLFVALFPGFLAFK